MLTKDKIIIVFYVGVRGCSKLEAAEMLTHLHYRLGKKFEDESCEVLFIPDYTTTGSKVECINPKLISDEDYKDVEKIVDHLRAKFQDLLIEKEKDKDGRRF